MAFSMRLQDIFRVRDRTILVGALDTDQKSPLKGRCTVEIDGREVAQLEIEGEVFVNTRLPASHVNLWTKSPINLDREVLASHEVWLIFE